ncbi:amino acid transporter-like protein, partial [Hortaea werneckii]
YKPYYPAVTKSTLIKTIEPIMTFAGQPPDQYQQQVPGFASQFNAVNTMVYSYAGALLFVAFLAEMRNPMDFWKGLFCAQAFICIVYLLFGLFVYSFWGQYSANNIVNVIRPYGLQTAGNVFTLLTGFIACFMYFNIGMKTIYLEVFQQIFNFPPISTTKGRIAWYCLGPCYWILAFIVAAAVPNLSGIVSLVGALFMINFTYSFPGMLYLSWTIQKAAALPGEGFNPYTRVTTRLDNGWKRWNRGFWKSWMKSVPALIYVLAGLACCGMGIWAAIEGLISIFGPGGTVATSFGCPAPV